MVNKRDLIRSRTPSDTELRYELSQIPNKVDKEPNKGLSTNDFTNAYKEELDKSVQDRHHHNNLVTLNHITTNNVDNWNTAYDTAKALIQPVQLYNDIEGTTGNIDFPDNPLNYNYIAITYGDETTYDNKMVVPISDKQFKLNLDTLVALYKFNNAGLTKVSGDDIYVYNVLGYIKKGAITFDSD